MIKKIKDLWYELPQADGKNSPIATLIGAPDDRGVLNVGGRLGANLGPKAVRKMLPGFMLGIDAQLEKIVFEPGIDVAVGATIEDAHAAVRKAVFDGVSKGQVPIVIGGGHDFGYPHAAGAADALAGKIAVINVDAHLDLRPVEGGLITSGAPFFMAIEQGACQGRDFVEFGIQEHCNDAAHAEYAKKKGVTVLMLGKLRLGKGPVAAFEAQVKRLAAKGLRVVVSFDIDAVRMAEAPGVSAPSCDGFTASEFLAMARFAGTHSAVVSVGFFELAPALELGDATTRLVCTAIHRFLCGLSERPATTKGRFQAPLEAPMKRLFRSKKPS